MKIYLTGSKGMLGSYCITQLSQKGANFIMAQRESFDLKDPEGCYREILRQSPDIVIHLAAETNVDLCETNPAHAAVFNGLSTKAIAKAAAELGSRVVYISSSNVFGHEGRQSYNELDNPQSLNYYGKSKLAGESFLKSYIPNSSLIIRAGWMIGGGKKRDHKFVGKIVQQIEAGAELLTAVDDKFGSITPASKLAEFISYAVENSIVGLYHYASKGGVSRYQIAQFIANYLCFKGGVVPVKSACYPLSAPRPVFETIDSVYLNTLSGAPLPGSWMEDLKEYIDELKR